MKDPPLSTSPTPSEKEWRKPRRRFSTEELRRVPCAYRVGLPRGRKVSWRPPGGPLPGFHTFLTRLLAGSGCQAVAMATGWVEALPYLRVLCSAKSLSTVGLCDPVDCSPPGSSVRGILLARILHWVAISFLRGSSQPRDQTQVSHIVGGFLTDWEKSSPWGLMQIGLVPCLFTNCSNKNHRLFNIMNSGPSSLWKWKVVY